MPVYSGWTRNYISGSICTVCCEPLGDNLPIGAALECGHCYHEQCYLDCIQTTTPVVCETCKTHITSFTPLFLEPATLQDIEQPGIIPTHPTICAICVHPLIAAQDNLVALSCGHCLHEECHWDYAKYKVLNNPKFAPLPVIECPTCKMQITSCHKLNLPVVNYSHLTAPPKSVIKPPQDSDKAGMPDGSAQEEYDSNRGNEDNMTTADMHSLHARLLKIDARLRKIEEFVGK